MINTRFATPQDIPFVFKLIEELALFEKAPNELVNSIETLIEDGFGINPLYYCIVAELKTEIVGLALCYNRYSTWKGKCLYLEDLIITENHRNKGYGKVLMNHVIEYARQNNYAKLQWQVLNWNKDAIRFYDTYKVNMNNEWLNVSLDL